MIGQRYFSVEYASFSSFSISDGTYGILPTQLSYETRFYQLYQSGSYIILGTLEFIFQDNGISVFCQNNTI